MLLMKFMIKLFHRRKNNLKSCKGKLNFYVDRRTLNEEVDSIYVGFNRSRIPRLCDLPAFYIVSELVLERNIYNASKKS